MPTMIGANSPKLYLGASAIDAMYLGTDKIYPNMTEQTISSSLPITFTGYGLPLTNYKIYGYTASDVSGSGVSINSNYPLSLNGVDTGVNFGALALFENEYADFEEQKVYQIGNYLDTSVIENGYYPTSNNRWQAWQNTTNMACTRTPILIPISQYSNVGNFKIYSDLSGYKCQIALFKGSAITTANALSGSWGSDLNFNINMPSSLGYPYVGILVHKSDWSDFNASALSGHIWIKYSNLDSSYVSYNTVVSSSMTLPTITTSSGQNTLTAYISNPFTMDITGFVSQP